MSGTFSGFGTRFYGQAGGRADGSFITTEWVTILYCPIFPFRSFRLVRDPGKDRDVVLVQSLGYLILEKLPLCWPQVGRVYYFMLFCVAWWISILYLFLDILKIFEKSDNIGMMVFIMVLLSAPWLYLWWLRHQSKKKKL